MRCEATTKQCFVVKLPASEPTPEGHAGLERADDISQARGVRVRPARGSLEGRSVGLDSRLWAPRHTELLGESDGMKQLQSCWKSHCQSGPTGRHQERRELTVEVIHKIDSSLLRPMELLSKLLECNTDKVNNDTFMLESKLL